MLKVQTISKTIMDFSLTDISFRVEKGDYFVLLGSSGSGKTTLLEILAGLVFPDSGRIYLNNRDISRLAIQKRDLGLVYQKQTLFPHLTVNKNIGYSLCCRGLDKAEIKARVRNLAEMVGASHLLNRRPGTLSGGEYQRVALARTLAREPACLLLDEPISALDAGARASLRSLLRKIHHNGQTIIHVTHDFEEAISLATKIAVMENGTLGQIGAPRQVFQHPKTEFIAKFLGVKNVFKGVLGASGQGEVSEVKTNGLSFFLLTEQESGPGFFMIGSQDITIANNWQDSSALNTFQGKVTDIAPGKLGVEVSVDIGVPIIGLITRESLDRLDLSYGKNVWINFKASAGRFIGE